MQDYKKRNVNFFIDFYQKINKIGFSIEVNWTILVSYVTINYYL